MALVYKHTEIWEDHCTIKSTDSKKRCHPAFCVYIIFANNNLEKFK